MKHLLVKPVLVFTIKLLQHFSDYTFLGFDGKYRNYKNFHEEKFLNDLKETNIIIDKKDPTKTTNL